MRQTAAQVSDSASVRREVGGALHKTQLRNNPRNPAKPEAPLAAVRRCSRVSGGVRVFPAVFACFRRYVEARTLPTARGDAASRTQARVNIRQEFPRFEGSGGSRREAKSSRYAVCRQLQHGLDWCAAWEESGLIFQRYLGEVPRVRSALEAEFCFCKHVTLSKCIRAVRGRDICAFNDASVSTDGTCVCVCVCVCVCLCCVCVHHAT